MTSMNVQAVQIVVRGRVQGVFFRATALEIARDLGLCGWARNRPEGDVEIHAEGEPQNLERMIAWCHKGPPDAHVAEVDVRPVPPENLRTFTIRYA